MLLQRRLQQRALLMSSLRCFFTERGFLEVDTPIRQPVLIPERHIEPLQAGDSYLQTSPEICMKRLLAHGCSKIFQICHCFRKNESGRRHLEEFTMLEWYHTGADYNILMEDCEALLRYVAHRFSQADKTGHSFFPGHNLDGPWEKITVSCAFERYAPCSVEEAIAEDRFDEILVESIEPNLGQERPTFLIDYPVELGSLARQKEGEPLVAERFELYLGGLELANGFTELTDEVEQRKRFLEEIAAIKDTWKTAVQLPKRFLQDLCQLQSAAGIALGVDRLLMLALGLDDISEVVTFSPQDL